MVWERRKGSFTEFPQHNALKVSYNRKCFKFAKTGKNKQTKKKDQEVLYKKPCKKCSKNAKKKYAKKSCYETDINYSLKSHALLYNNTNVVFITYVRTPELQHTAFITLPQAQSFWHALSGCFGPQCESC